MSAVLFQTIQFSISTVFLFTQTVLFKTIQFSMSTKLNGSKYCNVSLTIQLNISHFFTQFNVKTVLFQTTLFDPSIGMIAMKEYSTFPKDPALLDPHHQIVYCHIQDIHWGSLTPPQRWSQYILQLQPTRQFQIKLY